jgi:hypothetical protein
MHSWREEDRRLVSRAQEEERKRRLGLAGVSMAVVDFRDVSVFAGDMVLAVDLLVRCLLRNETINNGLTLILV